MDLYRLTEEDYEILKEIRHDLHRHPELSKKEVRTTEKIREFLEKLPGCRILDLPIQTGVAARIEASFSADDTNCHEVISGTEVMLPAD